ncbi:MAG TPA: hypothetical protein VD887_00650 [Allosphingosinicella sp.]|nr:hypothetical protein [Allosphingosinicella sp.]
MERQPDSPEPDGSSAPCEEGLGPPAFREPDPDPEIDALLDFTPVHRRTRRHDGWPPATQRAFIANLARMGSAEHAAYELGRSSGGAWNLRATGDGQEFADAWDAAIDLWHARNPERSRRGGRARGAWAPPPPPPPPEPSEEERWAEFQDGLLTKYLHKLDGERTARLAGRIVEADFCVRQLTWIEVALDLAGLGENAVALLRGLARGERNVRDIAATPVSLLLDTLRRAYWAEEGGPERPPLPPLGPHDEEAATGQPLESQHWPERDGPGPNRGPQHREYLERNAEAQRLWEEKAKADAEAWRKRLEGKQEEVER